MLLFSSPEDSSAAAAPDTFLRFDARTARALFLFVFDLAGFGGGGGGGSVRR